MWYDTVDSTADGVVTYEFLSMRIPGSQEKGRNIVLPKPNFKTFGLAVECWADVREVVGSSLAESHQHHEVMPRHKNVFDLFLFLGTQAHVSSNYNTELVK